MSQHLPAKTALSTVLVHVAGDNGSTKDPFAHQSCQRHITATWSWRMTEPNDDAFERRMDDASELLQSPEADKFVKALDLCGWMIVPKGDWYIARRGELKHLPSDGRCWLMNNVSNDCPSWADENR